MKIKWDFNSFNQGMVAQSLSYSHLIPTTLHPRIRNPNRIRFLCSTHATVKRLDPVA